MKWTSVLGLLAMIPAVTGPLPASAESITVPLCGGGRVSIPLSAPQLPGEPESPCCVKGCHSGQCRKRLDRTQ